jgi:endonuclease/exonuclease/phosphatase (EEP) superfamily protein YafD
VAEVSEPADRAVAGGCALSDRWLTRGFCCGLVVVLLLSGLGYLGELHYLLELTTHFKVQYFVAACCALFLFGLKRKLGWAALSLIVVALNLMVILPWYFPAASAESASQLELRVLLANVNVKNRSFAAAIALIQKEQPDLVAIVETNRDWIQALDAVKPILPYALFSPTAEGFGVALYSKFPLEAIAIEAPQEFQDFHLAAQVNVAGKRVTAIALRPPPPKGATLTQIRNQELEIVANWVRSLDTPIIALGDFNTSLWSPFYQKFVDQTQLHDSRQGFGILPTCPSILPPLYIPIDHCLISADIQASHSRTGKLIGSDHLSVIADLKL